MKRIIPAALAAGVLAVAGVAGAEGEYDKSKEQAQAGEQAGQKLQISSLEVLEVDRANNTITFKAEVEPGAQVQHEGRPLALENLPPGSEVRASFDEQGNITQLEVTKGGAEQPMEQPMEPPPAEEPGSLEGEPDSMGY